MAPGIMIHPLPISFEWTEAFLQEVSAFTGDGKFHDDQVDARSGVFEMVCIINEFKFYRMA